MSLTLLWKRWAVGQCAFVGLCGFAACMAVLAEHCRLPQPCGDLPSASGELCFWKTQANGLIPEVLSDEISKQGNQG